MSTAKWLFRPSAFAAGAEPRSIATGDFNNDTFLDVLVADIDSDQVLVRLNQSANSGVTGTGKKEYSYDPDFSMVTRFVDEMGRTTLSDIDPANGNELSRTEVVGELGGADDVVPLGSTFKLYVLAALADRIAGGELAWTDELAIRDELVPCTDWKCWLDEQRRVVRNAFGELSHPESQPDWSLLH